MVNDLKFILIEECPQVPALDVPWSVHEAYEKWIQANEKARVYILASIADVLVKKVERMVTAKEIMESMQEMFGQKSSQLKHDALKFIYNARMEECTSVWEHVLEMMVHFNIVEINGAIMDKSS